MPSPSAHDRILHTASELFHQRGFKEVGINEIIATSGTAKATFYSHFPSKTQLGETWLTSVHEASLPHHQSLLQSTKSVPTILKTYFGDLTRFLETGDHRGCPYTNTAAVVAEDEAGLQQAIIEHKESIREFFQQLAGKDISPPRRARALGDQFFLLYSGATTESQNLRDTWPVKAALAACLDLYRAAKSTSQKP